MRCSVCSTWSGFLSTGSNPANGFAHELAAAVPNTGSAEVTVPAVATGITRVRVACVDNIFFSLSPVDFVIGLPPDPDIFRDGFEG